jgi:NAD(P)-dependent dehydrogenase (short-subunit alcohol dehydrogenase family)
VGRLNGKVAIITGAASGQGAVEAKLFAKEGAKVIATDFQDEMLNKVVNEIITQFGDVAIAVKHDVTDESDWEKVIKQGIERFGKIDILVNNAGISGQIGIELEMITVDEWNKVMNVNALGNLLGIKYVVPEMKKNESGSIVNISSLAGISGMAGLTPYTASKGATRIMTKAAAVQLGKENIRVNSIHPGYIYTPMTASILDNEEVKKTILADIPSSIIGEPEDVAYGVLFLASDEARFINGAELIIDGGQAAK